MTAATVTRSYRRGVATTRKPAASGKARPPRRSARVAEDPDARYPSGRLRAPRGVRPGGRAWQQLHAELAWQGLVQLAERGYPGMAMDDVARAAGASVSTIYRHYPTKVDLAVAAIQQLPTFTGWLDGHDDPQARIDRAATIGAAHHPYFVPVLANAIVFRNSVPELLDTMVEHVMRPRQDAINALVEQGQARGEIRTDIDPTVIAALVVGDLVDDCVGLRPLAAGAARGRDAVERVWPLLHP